MTRFNHERVLEGAGVGCQCVWGDAEALTGASPARNHAVNFAQTSPGLGRLHPKARGGVQRGCLSPAANLEGSRRMVFNVFGCNRDDHTKNFGFIHNTKHLWGLCASQAGVADENVTEIAAALQAQCDCDR